MLSTGDVDFAVECHSAYLRGQGAVDHLLWNETGKYYNAYDAYDQGDGIGQYKDLQSNAYSYLEDGGPVGEGDLQANPDTPGAIMADTFYAQVSWYSLDINVYSFKYTSQAV